jgi:hypothetical protein
VAGKRPKAAAQVITCREAAYDPKRTGDFRSPGNIVRIDNMSIQDGSYWDQMPYGVRKALIWGLWFITWLGLVGGLFDRVFFEFVVIFSAIHAVLFLALNKFDTKPFPVQVRIAYFVWVAAGTYVPNLVFLMYITLVGLATNLFLGYCPLARMMYLMPWNRNEGISFDLVRRVFISPPAPGKFEPAPRSP